MPITEKETSWLKSEIPESVSTSDEWYDILSFFLIHSPCRPQSNRRQAIEDVWGPRPWASSRYLKRQLNLAITSIDSCPLRKSKRKSELDDALREACLLDSDFNLQTNRQVAVFTEAPGKGNSSVYMSFFYHLRNSLAHARFGFTQDNRNRYVLIFEDGKDCGLNSFAINARGLIRLDSLSRIIETIEAGPNQPPNIESNILGAIENEIDTKKKIMQELEINESDWRIYSQILKDEGKIQYKKGKWALRDN